jgi:hypothetical protein
VQEIFLQFSSGRTGGDRSPTDCAPGATAWLAFGSAAGTDSRDDSREPPMPTAYPDNIVLTGQAAAALRDDFLGWQCRIRQIAVRQAGGRPLPGMRPRVLAPDASELSSGIVVLIVERESGNSTALFRHQYLKTNDPIERYDKVLEILAASYFQQPGRFSDVMTASFGADSTLAARLLAHGRCILEFEQSTQAYRLPCKVAALAEADALYQATYWHNRMFNPTMPPGIRILAFTPDWRHASGWRVESD